VNNINNYNDNVDKFNLSFIIKRLGVY